MTKNEINTIRTRQKRSSVYASLKRGVVILLMIGMLMMGSFATATPSPLRIIIKTFSPFYSPNFVQITTGTPISWNNPTLTLHSITDDRCKSSDRCAFDSGPIGPNRSFTVRELLPGYYSYHCSFHPNMRGVLVVLESSILSKT